MIMAEPYSTPEERLTKQLDELLTDLRAGRTVDYQTWQGRHPETQDDLSTLMATVQSLEQALDDCRSAAAEVAKIADSADPPLPQTIGRYEVRGLLGAGGMGKVYLVYDPSLDREAALKLPNVDAVCASLHATQRFLREMRAAARVQHPNVCPIFDVGEHNGAPYVVMAYVKGRSLAELLDQSWEPLPAVRLIAKVGRALAAVHAVGLVHRDVKPGNILVDEAGEPYLADFGLARSVQQDDHLTNPGVRVGTPAFMAPEQVMGDVEAIGPATDVYALGMVLYRMLTGRLPFANSSAGMTERLTKQPPSPRVFRTDVDVSLSATILQALAREPKDRHASAAGFVNALETWCESDVDLVDATVDAPSPSQESVLQGQKTQSVVLSGLPGVAPITLQIPGGAKDIKLRMTGEEGRGRKRQRRWRLAVSFTLAMLITAGMLVDRFPLWNKDPDKGEVVVQQGPAPWQKVGPNISQLATKVEPWWTGIPNTSLTASVAALKTSAPQDQAIFEGIAAKSDVERYGAYEKLATKLPELARNPKAKEPLGRLITEVCVFEPSDRNLATLRTALTNQIPQEGAEFKLVEKGEDLDRAFWALQVTLDALQHKALRPEGATSLTYHLGKVFDHTFDPDVPTDQLKAQMEKLLALRCYRNTVPTAAKSIDLALAIRARLIEKAPQNLTPAFREKVDVDLVAVGLSQTADSWPRLEPILRSCLKGKDLSTGLRVANIYAKAEIPQAQDIQKIMSAEFKGMTLAPLTQNDNTKAIQSRNAQLMRVYLRDSAAPIKVTPTERLAKLQKLTKDSLKGAEVASAAIVTPELQLERLQHTVRLTHASTMACALYHKGAGLERFDDLIARIPDLGLPESNDPDLKKSDPKQPATSAGVIVGAQPKTIQGILTQAGERDAARNNALCKVHVFSLKSGQVYTIDLMSNAFDAYLRLESPQAQPLAADDDGGVGLNSRIVFTPKVDGAYRIIASSLSGNGTGIYSIQIQLGANIVGGGFGASGFGVPRSFPDKKRFATGVLPPFVPSPNDLKTLVSPSDLAGLESKQLSLRSAAFQSISAKISSELAPSQAQRIAKYLLGSIQQKTELDEVIPKLGSLAKSRHMLLALADYAGKDEATQRTTEIVVGGVLEQPLQFAKDENWRLVCRKMLLERAFELIEARKHPADLAADLMCDLYIEQGLAFGMKPADFASTVRPTKALEQVIKHVAAKARGRKMAKEDKSYLDQIVRRLQAAEYVADDDMELMALLQDVWIKVLSIYLHVQLDTQDQQLFARGGSAETELVDQLRDGEGRIVRLWSQVHNLK